MRAATTTSCVAPVTGRSTRRSRGALGRVVAVVVLGLALSAGCAQIAGLDDEGMLSGAELDDAADTVDGGAVDASVEAVSDAADSADASVDSGTDTSVDAEPTQDGAPDVGADIAQDARDADASADAPHDGPDGAVDAPSDSGQDAHDAPSDADGASDAGITCGSQQKKGGGVCVGNDPAVGCYAAGGCTAWAQPTNGTSACSSLGSCDFTCNSGYQPSAGQCEAISTNPANCPPTSPKSGDACNPFALPAGLCWYGAKSCSCQGIFPAFNFLCL